MKPFGGKYLNNLGAAETLLAQRLGELGEGTNRDFPEHCPARSIRVDDEHELSVKLKLGRLDDKSNRPNKLARHTHPLNRPIRQRGNAADLFRLIKPLTNSPAAAILFPANGAGVGAPDSRTTDRPA